MAEIKNPVKFTAQIEKLVSDLLETSSFTYRNWGDDLLEDFRAAVRAHYRKEQKGKCAYCKKDLSFSSPANCHVEHIAPKSKHPKFIFEPKNLCVICADCNTIKREQETLCEEPETLKKGGNAKIYPRASSAFLIFQPHFDDYDEHIIIFNDTIYVDLTKKGHFTIGACKLNRKVHELGWEQEIIDDAMLIDLMQSYLSNPDSCHRMRVLNKFKRLLIQM